MGGDKGVIRGSYHLQTASSSDLSVGLVPIVAPVAATVAVGVLNGAASGINAVHSQPWSVAGSWGRGDMASEEERQGLL
jgi:hypothetical protein